MKLPEGLEGMLFFNPNSLEQNVNVLSQLSLFCEFSRASYLVISIGIHVIRISALRQYIFPMQISQVWLVKWIHHADKQKSAWFENDFCVSYLTTLWELFFPRKTLIWPHRNYYIIQWSHCIYFAGVSSLYTSTSPWTNTRLITRLTSCIWITSKQNHWDYKEYDLTKHAFMLFWSPVQIQTKLRDFHTIPDSTHHPSHPPNNLSIVPSIPHLYKS